MDNEPITPKTPPRHAPLSAPEELTFWGRHRLTLLLIITIAVALSLTVLSMTLYTISGAAQLDLSRPGYQSVSDQVDTETRIESFSSFGPVTQDTLEDFQRLYDEQRTKAQAVDAFNGDPLNPELLLPQESLAE